MTRRYPLRRLAAAHVLSFLTLAVPAAADDCPDCDRDGAVAINELITAISIALDVLDLDACPAFDRDRDGAVTIDEITVGINAALTGCAPEGTPMPTPTATPGTPLPVPTAAQALQAWLRAGNYLSWPAESARHPSAGPHGGAVRSFVNPTLFDSLSAERAQHPAGAAAVKELYFSGQTVRGWAVMVKLQNDSDAGRGWYWLEDFGSGRPSEGVGNPTCTGCHSQGRDYVRIPFPLH